MRYVFLPLFSFFLFLSAFSPTLAQTTVQRDPQIAELVGRISADSLRAHIDGLVSFGTRHTMSPDTKAGQGIGAARRWVLGKFEQYARQSGGQLTAPTPGPSNPTASAWMP